MTPLRTAALAHADAAAAAAEIKLTVSRIWRTEETLGESERAVEHFTATNRLLRELLEDGE